MKRKAQHRLRVNSTSDEDTDTYEDEELLHQLCAKISQLNKYEPNNHHGVSNEDRHSCTAIIIVCNKFKATNQD